MSCLPRLVLVEASTNQGIRIRVDPHPPHQPATLHPGDGDQVLLEHVVKRVLLVFRPTSSKQGLGRWIGIRSIPRLLISLLSVIDQTGERGITYCEFVGELHFDGRRPLEATSSPLVPTDTTTMAAVTVRVGRSSRSQCLLSEVDLRDGDGDSDSDVGVSLRTVVDGRSRHCGRRRFAW